MTVGARCHWDPDVQPFAGLVNTLAEADQEQGHVLTVLGMALAAMWQDADQVHASKASSANKARIEGVWPLSNLAWTTKQRSAGGGRNCRRISTSANGAGWLGQRRAPWGRAASP